MNYIPKIAYTHISSGESIEFTFDSQPEIDPYNEEIIPFVSETRSNNGVRQVQFNYAIKMYTIDFKFQSEAVYLNTYRFLTEHAMKGGAFKYYPSSDLSTFEIWELDIKSVEIKRPTYENLSFTHDFSFTLTKVIDNIIELDTGEVGVGSISETSSSILNNQTVPQDISNLAFEMPDDRSIRAVYIEYTIYRNSTGAEATELSEVGTINGVWKTVEQKWYITREGLGDAGLVITIQDNGQLQYTSSNMTGTPSIGVMRFRARTISQEV